MVDERARRDEPERVVVRARANGRQHLVDLGGREDEAHVIRWFLDKLEERIEARGRHHVGLVDDVDLVARGGRREHRALAQFTGVVDAAVGRSVELDDVDGTRARRREVDAALAHPAGIRGRALLAVERAGQDASGRGLPAATGPGEQIGVVDAVVLQRATQRPGHMVLADDLVQRRRTVGAIQGHGHEGHPNADPRPAGGCGSGVGCSASRRSAGGPSCRAWTSGRCPGRPSTPPSSRC